MKRIFYVSLLYLISCNYIQAQASNDDSKSYVGDINKMFPAAPTANNLMKFEEVPVSYYTGIPDVSIPLFTIPTNNKNVNVSIQLKYHPLNAKPDDRSGETGLGWSLIAGGTISRTVRGGGPDEKNRTIAFSSPPKVKYGIYNETYNPTSKLINNESIDINEYAFNAAMGKYDTEYDLYQYNFMGNAGRFIIKKDVNGNFFAEKLDKNNLQIICNKDLTTGIIISFTIVDDKGIKYLFDAMEKSQKTIAIVKTGLTAGIGNINPTTEIGDYYAAFHLTKINDQKDVNLAAFTYDLASNVKFEETPTTTNRLAKNVTYTNTTIGNKSPDGNMPGASETQHVYNTSQTRLLTSIELRGKGMMYLNYEIGREDSNYTEPANLYKLKSIQTNYTGQNRSLYTDKYTFDYGYSNTNFQSVTGTQQLKKMLLKKVTKISPNNQNSVYDLDYNESGGLLEKDNWGYYKGGGITTDVIKSMTYPTKGKVSFDFGENDYSNYPVADTSTMEQVTGKYVTQVGVSNVFFSEFNANEKKDFFTIETPQTVRIHSDFGNLTYYNWRLTIYKKNGNNQYTEVKKIEGFKQIPDCPTCPVSNPYPIDPDNPVLVTEQESYLTLEAGVYYATLTKFGGNLNMSLSNSFTAYTTQTTFVPATVYKGGGLRVNAISYFENPASNIVSKKYKYNYNDINDSQRSSGALVFPEPVLSYSEFYSYKDKVSQPQIIYSADFDITTDFNILPVQKTQGSDVGYKYITVEQLDNSSNKKGKTVYQFRSPIDYPNEIMYAQMPIVPIPNYDYLRGQLISEKKYDANNLLVSENATSYTSTEYEKNDGIKIKDNFYNNMTSEYYQYSTYQEFINHFSNSVILTTPYKNFEKFGVTLPSAKQEISYFYDNGVQTSIAATTNNVYNSNDYPTMITQNFQDGNSTITNYKYAIEKNNQRLINANMIGIPLETESKKNNKLMSKVEILYNDLSHFFPSSILSYDILNNGAVFTEITYDIYDSFGNLKQYTNKDGISTVIIWGYNNTQPIAKIEGVKLSDMSPSLIDTIVSASNSDASAGANNDETALLSVLDIFRSNLSNYQVSTYTYDPLIGVRSVTPPSGVREIYKYDAANRLERIIDVSGKALKEFKYNYKN